jgi:hypothetical protein
MANAIGGVSNAQQVAEVSASHQAAPTPKQNSANNTGAPQDTVTISSAGRAASQAKAAGQTAKAGGDADHDGK